MAADHQLDLEVCGEVEKADEALGLSDSAWKLSAIGLEGSVCSRPSNGRQSWVDFAESFAPQERYWSPSGNSY